ncbi:HK97 gp10 family phage protein [Bacillus sp. JJ1532]|uniref:HK97 gp10 family phage protein n=1 Tax=unclassified Bacillus (in: firmicutes) TaxID=185979 RepID=UPI00300020A2
MASWGSVNFEQLKRLQKRMQQLERVEYEKFCEECSKELAARLLAKVIRRTPVGLYSKEVNFVTKDGKQVSFTASTEKIGGTLRRGWTTKTHQEAEASSKGKNAKAFADSLKVTKQGNLYILEVINPVEYASYVEFGHRTRNKKGWVKGRFMMTISADEVERQAPKIIEKKLKKLLGEAFDGDQ